MSRRIVLVAIWLAGTACAALAATFGVNLIGGRLTSPRLVPLSQADVVSQAEARIATSTTEPTSSAATTDPTDRATTIVAPPPTASPSSAPTTAPGATGRTAVNPTSAPPPPIPTTRPE